MKKIIIMTALACACSSNIYADTPTSSAALATALNTLNHQSYVVLELEYEHGEFEADVITAQGFIKKINLDANGMILSAQPKNIISMSDALQLAEKAGYTTMSSIKVHKNNTYEIEAVNAKNKEVDLEINAITGNIKVEHESWWD